MKRLLVSVVMLVAFPVGVAFAQTADAKKIEAGKAVYEKEKCATCHAIAGKGGKAASSLDGVGKKLSEADIRSWITHPADMEAKLPTKPKALMSTAMKSKKMTDADVDALVAYMTSLK